MPVAMQLNLPFTMEFMSCKRNDNVDWGIVCRPPQSALSARLSSRRIMINFDVKGTFYFTYIFQLVEACIWLWHYNIGVGLDNVIGHEVVSDYAIAYDNGYAIMAITAQNKALDPTFTLESPKP